MKLSRSSMKRLPANFSPLFFTFVMLLLLLTGLAGTAVFAAPPADDPPATTDAWAHGLSAEVKDKIDPRLIQELNGQIIPAHLGGGVNQTPQATGAPINQTRFLVYLKNQANLTPIAAERFAGPAERRAAVANRLMATAQATQGEIKTLLNAQMKNDHVTSYQPFYIFNGFAVEGDLETIIALARRDDIDRVVANYPLFAIPQPANPPAGNRTADLSTENWNIDLVDADRVWDELGVSGQGVVVGDFDTGVDWTHPALLSRYRGYNGGEVDHNYNWFEADGNLYPDGNLGQSISDVPYDCGEHGTHTMGTMVGDGGTETTHVGMAPGATWIASPGICGGTTPGDSISDDIGANKTFEWFLCPTDLSGDLSTRDCSLAPDVINNSWGSSDPADDTLRPAIQALRVAGIAPVFAAGNPNAGAGSIGSPASVPEAITVGATTQFDTIASFSGRGPSFYEGEQKPELSAPGDLINSTVPGGDYSGTTWSGTSMAAPAVSGLVALMVSADRLDGRRDLNVDEIESFMERTAVDLGTVGPDNDFGYGRINAYNAVRWVLNAGDLRGAVKDSVTSLPIAGTQMTGLSAAGDTFAATGDVSGVYSTTVPGGTYAVTLNAFGYTGKTFNNVTVIAGVSSVVDFSLVPLATATLSGNISLDSTPVEGAVVSVDAAPTRTAVTDAAGHYSLTLPVGNHALTVKADGHRVLHETVSVTAGDVTQDFALTAAPTILLVEADAHKGWFYGRPASRFFTESLDEQNYLYDLWRIEYTDFEDTQELADGSTGYGVPSLDTLSAYDLVIWAHPVGAPSDVSATDTLTGYLDNGGRLLLSGQNIGNDQDTALFEDYLRAERLFENAAESGDTVSGNNFLRDYQFTLSDGALYNYPNSTASMNPDSVAALTADAYPVMVYDNDYGGTAVLAVDPCDADYRALYFAVGYENLAPRPADGSPEYAALLDAGIQWLNSTKADYAVELSLDPETQSAPANSAVNYTLTVANTGANADSYDLALSGNAWLTQIFDEEDETDQTGLIDPCTSREFTVQVDIPTADLGDEDTFTVQAASQTQMDVTAAVTGVTTLFPEWQIETPMPVTRSDFGLAALPGTPYLFAIGGSGQMGYLPTVERYNACSGEWTALSGLATSRSMIAVATLDDKIYVAGGYNNSDGYLSSASVYDPQADAWSDIADMPVALGATAMAAANGKLYVFGGANNNGMSAVVYEYNPVTDIWGQKSTLPGGPRANAAAAQLNGLIYIVGGHFEYNRVDVYNPVANTWSEAAPLNTGRRDAGLTAAPDGALYVSGGLDEDWNDLFTAERYDPAADSWVELPYLNVDHGSAASAYAAGKILVMGGSLDSPTDVNESLQIGNSFCQSDKEAAPANVAPGGVITYTITLHGDTDAITGSVTDPIPTYTMFAGFGPATVSPAPVFNAAQNQVEWSGNIPANQPPVTFTFAVDVDSAPVEAGRFITNTAEFNDGHDNTFSKSAGVNFNLPDLSRSSKIAGVKAALANSPVTYTIRLINSGAYTAAGVVFTDPLPAEVVWNGVQPDCSAGTCALSGNAIIWNGDVPPAAEVVVTYGVTVATVVADKTPIINAVTIKDSLGGVITRQAVVMGRLAGVGASDISARPRTAPPAGEVSLTINISNPGLGNLAVSLQNPLPAELTYVPDSLGFGSGEGSSANGVITWQGMVGPQSLIPVQFRATINSDVPYGRIITNTAIITDTTQQLTYQREVTLTVVYAHNTFMPLILK